MRPKFQLPGSRFHAKAAVVGPGFLVHCLLLTRLITVRCKHKCPVVGVDRKPVSLSSEITAAGGGLRGAGSGRCHSKGQIDASSSTGDVVSSEEDFAGLWDFRVCLSAGSLDGGDAGAVQDLDGDAEGVRSALVAD